MDSYIFKTTIPKEDREFFSRHFRQIELSFDLLQNGYLEKNDIEFVLNIGFKGAKYCLITISNEAYDKNNKEYEIIDEILANLRGIFESGNNGEKRKELRKVYNYLDTYLIAGAMIFH